MQKFKIALLSILITLAFVGICGLMLKIILAYPLAPLIAAIIVLSVTLAVGIYRNLSNRR